VGFFTDRALPLHRLSPAMQEVYDAGARAVASEAPILILGEPGVGKNTMAYRLHALSGRSGKAFVSFHCPAIPESRVELELLGEETIAAPGGREARPGLFETANGGTVFIDEVGFSSPRIQDILNTVMETGEVVRVGGTQPRPIDVRFIATTVRDLEAEVTNGTPVFVGSRKSRSPTSPAPSSRARTPGFRFPGSAPTRYRRTPRGRSSGS